MTELDDFRGEPRNNDMVLLGDAAGRRIVVGLEAKADEPFGDIIAEYIKGRPEKSNGGAAPGLENLRRGLNSSQVYQRIVEGWGLKFLKGRC